LSPIASALTPFRNNQTSFWASGAITDTSKLGYTYPDFNNVDVTNKNATKDAISKSVNHLYGPGSAVFGTFAAVTKSPISGLADSDTAEESSEEIPASPLHNPAPPQQQHPSSTQVEVTNHPQKHMDIHNHPQGHVDATHPTVVGQSSAPLDTGIWDWTARAEFQKYELGTGFSVLFFLGPVPDNSEEWRISPNFVGSIHAFVNSAAESCANCQNQQLEALIIEGFVHLNHGIVEHSGLGSFEPDVVAPYLTQNLHWKVQKVILYI
jgi:tyrosinase